MDPQSGMDEDEAALYDRQIRLWGVEAQNRMRNSSVLVINLCGIASEVCKNLVLAGVGAITILDRHTVLPQDLGAGFFFREDDVGKLRVDAAKDRIESLNPRVSVAGLSTDAHTKLEEPGFMEPFDVVCVMDADISFMTKVSSSCRQARKPFFGAGSLGLGGYIFVDLIEHTYFVERETHKQGGECRRSSEKRFQRFTPLEQALKSKLYHVPPRRLSKVSPMLWATLATFEYCKRQGKPLSAGAPQASDLVNIARELLKERGLSEQYIPVDLLQRLPETCLAQVAPSCAVIGAVLSQEILNTIGGHQAPMVNFFVFDGYTSSGDIYALGVERG